MSHIIAQQRSTLADSPHDGRMCDVYFALRVLRYTIRERLSSIACDSDSEAPLRAMQALAMAARGSGYYPYGCVCLNLAEQLEELRHDRCATKRSLILLDQWVDHSNRYLRQPVDPSFVTALLEQLDHPLWGARLGQAEREILHRALLAHGA